MVSFLEYYIEDTINTLDEVNYLCENETNYLNESVIDNATKPFKSLYKKAKIAYNRKAYALAAKYYDQASRELLHDFLPKDIDPEDTVNYTIAMINAIKDGFGDNILNFNNHVEKLAIKKAKKRINATIGVGVVGGTGILLVLINKFLKKMKDKKENGKEITRSDVNESKNIIKNISRLLKDKANECKSKS